MTKYPRVVIQQSVSAIQDSLAIFNFSTSIYLKNLLFINLQNSIFTPTR